jgi:hypothetical protein
MAWVRTELESVDIGDKRLNKRLFRVIEKSWQQPQASIPKSMGTWTDTKAAYRLLKNLKVTPEKILEPHKNTVRCRIKEECVILAVQDTIVHRTRKPPEKPPTLGEAMKLVARVGGFLARKGDGAPGPTVLWRGLQELATISFAWFAFGPERSVH